MQFINNLFVNGGDASQYSNALIPVTLIGNVYIKGAANPIKNIGKDRFGEMNRNAKDILICRLQADGEIYIYFLFLFLYRL